MADVKTGIAPQIREELDKLKAGNNIENVTICDAEADATAVRTSVIEIGTALNALLEALRDE